MSSCYDSAPHRAFFTPSPDLRSLLLLVHDFCNVSSKCKDGAKITVSYPEISRPLDQQQLIVTVANKCHEDGTHVFTFDQVVNETYGQRCFVVTVKDQVALVSAFRSWIRALRSLTGGGDTAIVFSFQWKPSSHFDERGDWSPWSNPCSWTTRLLTNPEDDSSSLPDWTVVRDVEDYDVQDDD